MIVSIIVAASENNVIGWFQDKMEFGPRALGNRSILADPRNPNMKDIINSKINLKFISLPKTESIIMQFLLLATIK